MVKRQKFQDELMSYLIPNIFKAQDELGEKYGLKFSVDITWELAEGYKFDDEHPQGKGHHIGG